MAKEFKWDRPTITVSDIIDGLVKQYGPEQPIVIELTDKKQNIQYKTSMIPVSCNRCGNKWSTSPYILLKGYYMFGYVCSACGNISDEELKAKKKDSMNKEAIKQIKEQYGDDVFEQDAAEEKSKEEEAKAEKEIATFSKEDYEDAFATTESEEDYSQYMANDEETSSIGETISAKSEAKEETIEESDEEEEVPNYEDDDVVPDYEDDDDDFVEEDDESVEETSEESLNVEEEVQKAVQEQQAKAKAELEALKAEKAKAVEEAKQEAMREAQRKADEEKAAYADKLRAEMKAEMEAKIEAEKAKAKAEIEEAKAAKEKAEADKAKAEEYAAEQASLRAEAESKIEEQESEDEYVEEEGIDDDDGYEDSDEDYEVDIEEDESDEEETTEEASEESMKYDVVVGEIGYSNEEFDGYVKEELASIRDELGFTPWNKDKITVNEDNEIEAECIICRKTNKFNTIDRLGEVTYIGKSFCELHGIDEDHRINNVDGKAPSMHCCKYCKDSIAKNGYNEYYKAAVMNIAESAHFTILNADKRLFVPTRNEYYEVECNGVKKGLYRSDLMKFINKDARTDPMFKAPEVKAKSTESATTTVEEKSKVIKFKSSDESQQSTNSNSFNPSTGPRVIKFKPSSEREENKEKVEKKPTKEQTFQEKMSEKYNKGPHVENAKDTNASLEEERYVAQEEIRKNSIFKRNQKVIMERKSVAKLNGKINPFERESTLKEEFQESIFCDFISNLSDETGVDCYLTINEHTLEIPVVDFESGVRIICANLNERAIPNVPFEILGDKKRLPFHYTTDTAEDDGTGVLRKRPKNFKWMILYSDSIEERKDATMEALVKFINPKKLAYEGNRIKLEDNLDFEYTTHDQFLRDFDMRYSTFPSGKPKTGQLGIIATWNSNKKVTSKDVLNFQMQISAKDTLSNLNSLENDYSQYMCCSIRYIEKFNKDTNRVIYDITEYVEVGSALIDDGLKQCIRALLKEYQMKYGNLKGISPYVILECDQNVFLSPSVRSYIDEGTLIPVNDSYQQMVYGSQYQCNRGVDQYKRYCYVRMPEYRTRRSDSMRTDLRMFSTSTLVHKMSDEIKQAGIQNTISDPNVRNLFIRRMGFVKCRQAEIKEYFFSQAMLTSLLLDGRTMAMRKHIEADSMFQTTNMVTDSNLGIGINNIFTNPQLIAKYNRIMTNGTDEAKQYMMGTMYQQNPNMYYQMQSFNPMMQQNGINQFGMGMGMNPMMMNGMSMMPNQGF